MITTDQVAGYLHAEPTDPHLPVVVAAVIAQVTVWHGDDWPAGVQLGAIMLAARLHRRRNSPAGVEAAGELGPVYVARYDSDLDRNLQIGAWAPPRVG